MVAFDIDFFDAIFNKLNLCEKYPFIDKNKISFLQYMQHVTSEDNKYSKLFTQFKLYVSKEGFTTLNIDDGVNKLDGQLYPFNVQWRHTLNNYIITEFIADFCGMDFEKVLELCQEMIFSIIVKDDNNENGGTDFGLQTHMVLLLAEIFAIFKLCIDTESISFLYHRSNEIFDIVHKYVMKRKGVNHCIKKNLNKFKDIFDCIPEEKNKTMSADEYINFVIDIIYQQMKQLNDLINSENSLEELMETHPEFDIIFGKSHTEHTNQIKDHRSFYYAYVLPELINKSKQTNNFVIPIDQLKITNTVMTVEI
jgi:hypothetical protein